MSLNKNAMGDFSDRKVILDAVDNLNALQHTVLAYMQTQTFENTRRLADQHAKHMAFMKKLSSETVLADMVASRVKEYDDRDRG